MLAYPVVLPLVALSRSFGGLDWATWYALSCAAGGICAAITSALLLSEKRHFSAVVFLALAVFFGALAVNAQRPAASRRVGGAGRLASM